MDGCRLTDLHEGHFHIHVCQLKDVKASFGTYRMIISLISVPRGSYKWHIGTI